MTSLDQFLSSSDTRAADLARRVGISVSHLSDLRRGRRGPSLQVALRLEVETAGAVRAVDWQSAPRG